MWLAAENVKPVEVNGILILHPGTVYNGIQLLDFFNPEEITFSIIFTTAFNEYAIRAFEMSAIDYLKKPIQEEKLRISVKN
jgi:two-component SAPR family response regulator